MINYYGSTFNFTEANLLFLAGLKEAVEEVNPFKAGKLKGTLAKEWVKQL